LITPCKRSAARGKVCARRTNPVGVQLQRAIFGALSTRIKLLLVRALKTIGIVEPLRGSCEFVHCTPVLRSACTGLSKFNTSGVVPIQTEHASTTIHGINVKINDSPEKMCGITRRDTRVPVRRRFAANLCGTTRGQDSPLQHQRFLVLGDRNSGVCWRSGCRLAPT
jgi:hypothetical protein